MLAVLLSFGAVNSLIPLLIIIILIAAAAGLTRGYNLFAIFGIGTLVGAASAAKKGSVVGRNPYRAVAAKPSSLFMPKAKSRNKLKAEREERKKNKETAKRVVNDIDQQLKKEEREETKSEEREEREKNEEREEREETKSEEREEREKNEEREEREETKSEEREEREKNEEIEKETGGREEEENEEIEKRISTILKTGNYFGHPKQKGKYVKLAETAAKIPVPAIQTPYKGYLNKLKHNEEIRKAVRAEAKNLVMSEREQYLESITTAMAAEIGQLIKSGKWDAMSEKQKIALVEKGFVRPVKGQRSKVAMAGALLSGNIKDFKEELNKAPSNTKALIGIVGALATGAGAGGARRAIINELKKMPNYGAQTQPVEGFEGPQIEVFEGPQGKIKSLVRFVKSPPVIRMASFVFLSPIGWFAVKEIGEGINKIKQKGKE